MASQKQLTAIWFNLATMLVIQLDPPALLPVTFKTIPTSEARAIVLSVLASLTQTSLSFFSQPGSMKDVRRLGTWFQRGIDQSSEP